MKPLEFFLIDAARFFFKERAEAVLRPRYAEMMRSSFGAGARANLRRILTFKHGAPPSEEDLNALAEEMSVIYLQHQMHCGRIPAESADYIRKTEVRIIPELESLLKRGKGAVLAACHMEPVITMLGAAALAKQSGLRVSALADFAEPYQDASRVIPNLRYLPMLESAAPCLAALRRNEVVFLLGDIDYFPGNRTADFFGAPFHPPQGAVRLAMAAQAPIFPVYGKSDGDGYFLSGGKAIEVGESSDQEALESELSRAYERIIAGDPARWLVMRDAWDLENSKLDSRRILRKIRLFQRIRSFWPF